MVYGEKVRERMGLGKGGLRREGECNWCLAPSQQVQLPPGNKRERERENNVKQKTTKSKTNKKNIKNKPKLV